MADVTLTNVGTFSISGAALKTAVDGLTAVTSAKGWDGSVSGSMIHFVPVSNGSQVMVIKLDVA